VRDAAPWLLAIALALAVTALAYAAVWVAPKLAAEAPDVTLTLRSQRETTLITGVVFRDERLLAEAQGYFRLYCADAQRVPAGAALGVAAPDGEAFFRGWLLLRLERELAEAGSACASGRDALAAECARLRAAVAARDHDAAAELAGGLQARLFPDEERTERLRRELEALRAAGAEDTILIAPESGFFLRATDGWEGSAGRGELRAEMLAAMAARGREPTRAVGKLVTGRTWRLAAATADEARFAPGQSVTLTMDGREYTAEVTGFFPGGVVFTGYTGLEELLGARFVTAEAVLSETEGYFLPAAALRREGEETYILRRSGPYARREAVRVLASTADGVLVDGEGLRPGQRVLLGDYTEGERIHPKE